MIFNSITYVLFLAVFTVLYWWLPRTPRHLLILAGSLVFYGLWRFDYIPVMLTSLTIDYVAGRAIQATDIPARRRLFLAASLAGNLGMLLYFKYTGFAIDNMNGILSLLGSDTAFAVPHILLPLGISFYTFQSISYTVDVYRRFIPAERNYVVFTNFVIFFPQLVAGPILRGREVLTQLVNRPAFQLGDITWGLRRILIGLFLKVGLADNIAPLVDQGYAQSAASLGALDVWTLAFLFGFQIYFDFAAYSHLAIGSARLLGIRFPENFNFPYLATSPREFWRRWHISLSSWIRDYLYLPLCGQKVRDDSTGGLGAAVDGHGIGEGRRTIALVATWAIMGLWHGANWTFVAWGLWHAVLVLLHRLWSSAVNPSGRWAAMAGWVVTLPLIMLGWVPFRATTLSDTLTMWKHVLVWSDYIRPELATGSYGLAAIVRTLPPDTYMACMALILVTTMAGLVQRHVGPWLLERRWSGFVLDTSAYAVMATVVLVFLRPVRQFIYFQF